MFIGNNFWYGVVEDRYDPLMIGRVRVRIFGIHSPLKVASQTEGSPSGDLLWCHVMTPVTSASISGVGHSPTGIVEGSHVVGFFRDPMCQDGIVLGTLAGIPTVEANPNVGFNDPNGQYPRYINEPDTNTLARGGVVPPLPAVGGNIPPTPPSNTPASVEEQNLNRDEAVAPDKTPEEDIKPSPIAGMTIEEMLKRDEGVRVQTYWDHLGFPTIGIGHLIIHEKTKNMGRINQELSKQVGRTVTDGRITMEEVSKLFARDLSSIQASMRTNKKVGPVYAKLDDVRKMALENMCFQMGVGGVANFTRTLGYMFVGDWAKARAGMLDSAWARQTPGRANRVSLIILNGNLASYGVVDKSRRRKRSVSREESGGILFTEPASPYAAKYPFNQVYQSESGHTQEFDDTAGAERIKTKHMSGTFVEYHPDGTVVTKIIGEDYLIVKNNRNVHVAGNLNVVIEGNSTVYCLGNMDTTVDGNVTQLVRGNVTEQIDGDVNQTVNGNATQVVKGNVVQQVEGTVEQTVTGNVSQTLNASVTQAVKGNFNTTVDGNYSLTVKGDITSSATGTNKVVGNGASVEMNNQMKLSASLININ